MEVPQFLVFLCTNAQSMHRSMVKNMLLVCQVGSTTGKVIAIMASPPSGNIGKRPGSRVLPQLEPRTAVTNHVKG